MKKRILYLMSALSCLGLLVLFGCSSGDSTPAPTPTTLSSSTDASQSFVLTGSTAALPSGVSASNLTLTSKAANEVPAAPAEVAYLAAVDCGPTGIEFSQPVTLTFKLTPARTPGEVLAVYCLGGGVWTAAGTSAVVSSSGLTASASITHFSTYGLFAPVNAVLPGDKYFTFASGVNDGGSPSEIMYNDTDGTLIFPHASALQVSQAYADISQAPYGVYQDSNGVTPPTFTATAGTIYVVRSTMSTTVQYYKLKIVSSSVRTTGTGGTNYGVVTFSYVQLIPNAFGEWQFPNGAHLSVLTNATMLDYHVDNDTTHPFYMISGDYANGSTLTGTYTMTNQQATGSVTVTLSLTTDGKLNATLIGVAPLGSATLTGGIKQ